MDQLKPRTGSKNAQADHLVQRRWISMLGSVGPTCWTNVLDGAELTCLPIQLQAKIAILILLSSNDFWRGNDIKILTAKVNCKFLIYQLAR